MRTFACAFSPLSADRRCCRTGPSNVAQNLGDFVTGLKHVAPPTAPVLRTQIRKASSTQMSMAMFVTQRTPVLEPSAEEYAATQLKNVALAKIV